LRIDAELMPALKLTSITSLSHFDLSDYRDTDGSVLNVFAVQQVGRINSFSQELRASGATADGRLQYVAGGFYANDRTWENNRSILPDSTSANPFVAITGAPFLGVEVPTNQKTLTKAVFGNVDFKLNSRISFHTGARHTWSSVDFSGCMKDIDGLFAPGANLILGRINPGASPAQAYSCVTVLPDKTVGSPMPPVSTSRIRRGGPASISSLRAARWSMQRSAGATSRGVSPISMPRLMPRSSR
jgi:iron complex outermembrane receptor protein